MEEVRVKVEAVCKEVYVEAAVPDHSSAQATEGNATASVANIYGAGG